MLTAFRTQLPLAVLALGLVAVGLTAWESSAGATAALRQATFDRLTGIRESKRGQIEDYFRQLTAHVTALSSDESTIQALEDLRQAWDELPDENRQARLHRWFITDSPFGVDDREQLLQPPGSGRYGEAHARFHPTLQRYRSAFGFYDILIVDRATSRVVYSVRKESDLGALLSDAEHAASGLGRVVAKAATLTEPGEVATEDYAPYPPSDHAPAAFVAAPIRRAGGQVGVLVIQVAVDEVNRVMTAGRNWSAEGLGATGQTYIAGQDGRLRSDARFELEHADQYLAQLAAGGLDTTAIARIRQYRTGVLTAPVSPDVRTLLDARASGTSLGHDVRGVTVLRSYAPVSIPGLSWFLVAEIDADEAFAPVVTLQRRMWTLGGGMAALVLVVGWWLSRSMTAPIATLAAHAGTIGRGDFQARVPVRGPAEMQALAGAFNRMADTLQHTTVSRDALNAVNAQLHVLAGRLIEAQEEERRRIAADLHDDVTQQLAALSMTVGELRHHRAVDDPGWDTLSASVQQQIAALSAQLHSLARQLHPAILDDLGLTAALEAECQVRPGAQGPAASLRVSGPADRMGPHARLALYRAVQESLRNARRHAQATRIDVTLEVDTAGARLSVSDDGRGFDRRAPGWRPGVGLAAMEERVRGLGGTVELDSAPGEGTTVLVTLPERSTDAS